MYCVDTMGRKRPGERVTVKQRISTVKVRFVVSVTLTFFLEGKLDRHVTRRKLKISALPSAPSLELRQRSSFFEYSRDTVIQDQVRFTKDLRPIYNLSFESIHRFLF